MPSRASSHAKRIYRSVGLSWNEQPFAVSATGRKRKSAAQRLTGLEESLKGFWTVRPGKAM